MEKDESLVIDGVHKQLGAVRALAGVSLAVQSGTVHGVIGHNGSGKSTLVKILSGVLACDRGSFRIVATRDGSAGRARRPRVATVFQDLGLADHLTVFENILVNSFNRTKFGIISDRRERARVERVLSSLGFELPLGEEAVNLSEAERVIACVVRALFSAGIAFGGDRVDSGGGAAGADVLLLDEPTSSLPRAELEKFRRLVKRLKDEARLSILIVTHNPSDVSAMCDEFTALKSGRVLCSLSAEDVSTPMLAALMAGKDADGVGDGGAPEDVGSAARPGAMRPVPAAEGSPFVVSAVMAEGLSAPVTLTAKRGEVLGITGLEGSGFREFVAAAAGVRELISGSVLIAGRSASGGVGAFRRAYGVYIPADRARTSGVPDASVYENMTLGIVDNYCRSGFIRRRYERREVARMLERLNVYPPDPRRKLSELSGGQQQKVVVGRALLATHAKVVIFEDPTAAVDVGAREDILRYMRELAAGGTVVVIATAEFEWLPPACDRIVVFRAGEFGGELQLGEMAEEAILRLAYGA